MIAAWSSGPTGGSSRGTAGARGEGVVPAGAEAGDQLVEPAPGDAVEPGDLPWASSFEDDRVDDVALEPHGGNPP